MRTAAVAARQGIVIIGVRQAEETLFVLAAADLDKPEVVTCADTGAGVIGIIRAAGEALAE